VTAKDVPAATGAQSFKKPFCFVENKGQIADENNHKRRDIDYKLSSPGMNLYIGNGQLKYQFKKTEGTPQTSLSVTGYEMDVTLLGVNPHAKAVSSDEQAYVENYYTAAVGPKGVTAHTFHKVTYKNVYHNIDWVLYVKNDKLEYDFVVRPGGNVKDIKIKYDGATALSLNKDGGITAETPMGSVEEKTPYAYETSSGKAVASKFMLKDNVVSFNTTAYMGSLTIDPALNWSNYFGGPGEDVATSVQVNASGTFLGGYTDGAVLPAVSGGTYTTFGGGTYDAFIAKYGPAGLVGFTSTDAMLWSTYYGGAGDDYGTSVALDNPGGFVYLAGYTNSTGRISTSGSIAGTVDGFLAQFNSTTGHLNRGTYFGGADTDYCNAVACDVSGNVYIAGQTKSTGLAVGISSTLSGPSDAFIAKYTAGGTLTWARYYGGTSLERAMGVACDNTGSVIITGRTNSTTGIATAGAYQSTLDGFDDAFIAKFNDLGMLLWGTYYGGSGEEIGNGIAVDPSNNIAVVGSTSSPDNITSAKAFQPVYAGGPQDAFVAYFTSAGANVWSTYYGGPNPDYGQGVCFDAYNDVVIAGATFSSTGISNVNGSPQRSINGSYDAFLAKLTPQGQQIWGTYFGGTLYDFANAVACNTTTDRLTIAGFTSSNGSGGSSSYASGGISNGLVNQPTYQGGTYDGFVTEFFKDTFLLINQPFVDTILCEGGTLSVPFTVYSTGVSYLPGNNFVVQMSDIRGNFASPTVIGTGTSSPVICTVPMTPGTGYRIRIVTNSPAYTSPDDFYDLTITGPSLPVPSIGASTPVCLGNTLYLYSSAPYVISAYNWSGPGGYFASLPDPVRLSMTLADAGTYTLITAHNGCPPDTVSVAVTVNPIVTPPTPVDSGSVTCDGSTLYLFANSGVPGAHYYWSGPAGFSTTVQNPSIPVATSANSGVYTVVDTVASCQSLPSTITANILPLVPTSSSITADLAYLPGKPGDTICFGTLVTFTALPVNGGFSPSYQWMSGPSSPIVGAVASTYSSSTLLNGEDIYCIVTSSLTCPLPATTTTNSIAMNVINTPPTVFIASSPAGIVVLDSSVTFTSSVYNGGVSPLYQWELNNVPIPGATNSTFTIPSLTQSDTVSLILTSTMACATPATASSNTIIVQTNEAVRSIPSPLGNIGIFPNPNNGSFTVKGSVEGIGNSLVSLKILNTVGQVIYNGTATIQNNELNKSIDLQNIPDGIYLLHVSQENVTKTFRFTVQR